MNVLIAEDDRVSRQLLASILQGHGYEVEAVADGVAAWEALERRSGPALAILDVMMPGMSGLDVCRKAREQRAAEHDHLILLTARADREDILAGIHAGASDYITKPFNRLELQVRVSVGARFVEVQQRLLERLPSKENARADIE